MHEESTTPDLVRLVQQVGEAANRRDLDAVLEPFAPDAVWDMSAFGMGVFHGRRAIHAFWRIGTARLRRSSMMPRRFVISAAA